MDGQQQSNNRLTLKLLAAVVAMFGFGFALVPLYAVSYTHLRAHET